MKLLAMTYGAFEQEVYSIFTNFIVRGNKLNQWDAVEEANRMQDIELPLLGTPQEREEKYLTHVRIGATFKLNRKERRDLLLSLENAINHASFSDYQLAEGIA